MLRIGIECHALEANRWGVGHHLAKLLEEISIKSELANEFRFYLYFKGRIPDDSYLNNPIFVKRILKLPLISPSFNIFFHFLLPLVYFRDHLQAVFFAGFMLPAFFLGKSLVLLTSDVYYEYTQGQLPFRYKLSYALFANWAAWRATKITSLSNTDKEEIVKMFKIAPEKISVNYLGVDQKQVVTSLLQFVGDESDAKKGGNHLPLNYLLYVGQAFPRRRAKETIQSFAILAPKYPDLKLILVGQDKYNPPVLQNLVKETNQKLGGERIIYHGYIENDDELQKLMAGAKLFIYLSSSEAFGIPPLEALAAGVPPIVKDNDLNHELYEGHAFYVKDEKDPVQIALALEKAPALQGFRNGPLQTLWLPLRNLPCDTKVSPLRLW
ncbi:MAG: group 1 glycosyl transferase [Parcubacteria group bacterium Gr01-1014_44]|nr:MAG: group 1 glycosyl transferase [Parcubacteria group bacterium Gr01-1014_44]